MNPLKKDSTEPFQVLLVDDHAITLRGVQHILNSHYEWSIISAERTCYGARRVIQNHSLDFVITDLHLPDGKGIELISELKKIYPSLKSVLYTMEEGIDYIKQALALGIDGYILKSDDEDDFVLALKVISQGRKWHSAKIASILAANPVQTNNDEVMSPDFFELTKKEKEIIVLIAKGYQSAEIMKEQGIASSTYTTHRQNIFKKLGVNSDVGIYHFAFKVGWIEVL